MPSPPAAGLPFPLDQPTFMFFTKADPNYCLTIRDGQLILARSNSNDPAQEWIRDDKYSELRDEEGFPAFALVNKATGQALEHLTLSVSRTPVQLTKYDPDKLDGSVLWTFGPDLGDGYRALRPSNNVRLNMDASRAIPEYGGVHDGTTLVLWEWNGGDNQKWRIFRH